MANSLKDEVKNQARFEAINAGGDKIADSIYGSLPKPKTTGGKILFGLCTLAGAFFARKMLSDKNGNISRSDAQLVNSIHRGITRRRIYDKD